MNSDPDIDHGVIGTMQGVGQDEFSEAGKLQESNLTIMSFDQCFEWSEANATASTRYGQARKRHLTAGLSDDLLCTLGICSFDDYGDVDLCTVGLALLP